MKIFIWLTQRASVSLHGNRTTAASNYIRVMPTDDYLNFWQMPTQWQMTIYFISRWRPIGIITFELESKSEQQLRKSEINNIEIVWSSLLCRLNGLQFLFFAVMFRWICISKFSYEVIFVFSHTSAGNAKKITYFNKTIHTVETVGYKHLSNACTFISSE